MTTNMHKRLRHLHASILKRCYDEQTLKRNPNYVGCTVAEDFYNVEDFIENIKKVPNYEAWVKYKNFQLDKDILFSNNKIYSSETCLFIPKEINIIVQCGGQKKSNNLPNGVVRGKARNSVSYIAQCRGDKGTNRHLGTYYTVDEAFDAFVRAKQRLLALKVIDHFEYLDDESIDAILNYIPHKEYR